PQPERSKYLLSYAHRWPLGTSYPQIVRDVARLVDRQHTQTGERLLRGSTLAVDQTGVGAPCIDLFREARLPVRLVPVLITPGQVVSVARGAVRVAKVHLVSVLLALLQSERLAIGPVPQADVLKKELALFSSKITRAGNEVFESLRERDHDDLTLSTAI